jgi:biotin carboxylase
VALLASTYSQFSPPYSGYPVVVKKLNVFVLGLDEANLETMGSLPHLADYHFHPLLSIEELQLGDIRVDQLLQKAREQLEAFDGSIDAIVGYWDFPVSSMVPILVKEYGLRGPSLESVVKCEHKYWSRLEQQKVTDAHPRFGLVDLEGDPKPPDGVPYPFWMKPVKSFSSQLAFKVENEQQFKDAVAETKEGIGRLGEPFEYVLEQLDLPPEIAEIGGEACLAEEALSGARAATEGYVFEGKPHVYGVLDSISYPGQSSFLRHQYPSQLPHHVQDRLAEVSEQAIRQIGLDNATFSVEFFCDPESDDVNILEINPRHSQSHAELFEHVDGVPNHHCMLSLAIGRRPELPRGQGEYGIAALYYHRHFGDGVVRRAPSHEKIAEVERDIPGVTVHALREEGERLSNTTLGKDSYSVELAEVIVAGADVADMEDKYRRCIEALGYDVDAEEETD